MNALVFVRSFIDTRCDIQNMKDFMEREMEIFSTSPISEFADIMDDPKYYAIFVQWWTNYGIHELPHDDINYAVLQTMLMYHKSLGHIPRLIDHAKDVGAVGEMDDYFVFAAQFAWLKWLDVFDK